jgi:hypothetical protein
VLCERHQKALLAEDGFTKSRERVAHHRSGDGQVSHEGKVAFLLMVSGGSCVLYEQPAPELATAWLKR